MKLFWSSRSPFAHKVSIAAHELDAVSDIDLIPTIVGNRPTDLLAVAPLGQIPVLITREGFALANSPVICSYLDETFSPGRLVPTTAPARWQALAWQSLADGMMNASLAHNQEIRRATTDESKAELRAFLPDKVERGLSFLELGIPALLASPITIGHIAIASALHYLDFRSGQIDWRSSRPGLSTWLKSFDLRPSVSANPLRVQD